MSGAATAALIVLVAVACVFSALCARWARDSRDEARSAAAAARRAVAGARAPEVDAEARTETFRRPDVWPPSQADTAGHDEPPTVGIPREHLGTPEATAAAVSLLTDRSVAELGARPLWLVLAEDGKQLEEAPPETPGGPVRFRLGEVGAQPAAPWSVPSGDHIARWLEATSP